MIKVGIISDTHSVIDEKLYKFFKDCEIVIHAGDTGNISIIDVLSKKFKVYTVFGNIDGTQIRQITKESEIFTIEKIKVLMTHIGGYPNKYVTKFRKQIINEKPDLVITGHSHILKVIFDKKHNHLHINPGAYGKSGFHKVRTAIRLVIDGSNIKELEILEIKR